MSDFPGSISFDRLLPVGFAAGKEKAQTATQAEVTALFEEFRNRVVRYLLCLGLSIHDGEEITQEVFILLFQHLSGDKSRENLRGWIFRVAHNLGLKKRIENRRWNEEPGLADFTLEDPAPSPEEQVIRKQGQRRLLAALEALPVQDQSCLYLRAEGLQYREIAHVLDISLGGVSQSLARAVKRLHDAYHR